MALVVKSLPANAEDERNRSLILGLERSPGGADGNSLQYSCLENLMGREPRDLQSMGHKESDTTE